jgi:hypothetical protein
LIEKFRNSKKNVLKIALIIVNINKDENKSLISNQFNAICVGHHYTQENTNNGQHHHHLGTVYPSGAPEFNPVFSEVRVTRSTDSDCPFGICNSSLSTL